MGNGFSFSDNLAAAYLSPGNALLPSKGNQIPTVQTLLNKSPDKPVTTTPTVTDQQKAEVNKNADAAIKNKKIYKFPLDIETAGGAFPYMLFKIYETKTGVGKGQDPLSQQIGAAASDLNTTLGGVPGAVLTAGETLGVAVVNIFGADYTTSAIKNSLNNFTLQRNVESLGTTIALLAPDGISTSYTQDYSAVSMTADLGGLLAVAQFNAAQKAGGSSQVDPFIYEAAGKLATKLPGVSDDASKLIQFGLNGTTVNPQLELLYNSPALRSFVFEFRMVPRSADESAAIRDVVRVFKYFSAPTIPDNSTGRYFIPPSQFEIEFYNQSQLTNDFLFKTKKCVLKNVSVDYMPGGVYSTHADGSPMEVKLSLEFQETIILTSADVWSGY
jgi:hypothetical protein